MQEGNTKISNGKSLSVLIISIAILLIGVAYLKANVATCLMISGLLSIYLALAFGCKWGDLEKNIGEAINTVYIGIFIMMLVGMLIGSWMSAGTVPLLMYYGLLYIPPSIFLVATCLLCSVMSIMTGTSWGTVGTIGIALIGVAEGLGIPLPYTVGAIVVGALVGDKLSPLSDTTVLAPTVSGANIYEHIKSMLFTTVPALVVSLALYGILGAKYGNGTVDGENYNAILTTLKECFNLNPIVLIPPVLVLVLILMKKPTIPVFGIGIFVAGIIAMAVQGMSLTDVIGACASGFKMETGNDLVDSMVNRGGMLNMMSTISIIIAAALLSGGLKTAGVFDMLLETMQKVAKSTRTVLGGSYLLHLILCTLTGSYFVTFSIVGPMLGPVFDKYDLNRKNLSRMLEDTGTTFAPLVPWSTFSIYILGTLGVSSYDYVLYSPLTYMGLVFAAIYIITGFGIWRTDGTMYFTKKKDK